MLTKITPAFSALALMCATQKAPAQQHPLQQKHDQLADWVEQNVTPTASKTTTQDERLIAYSTYRREQTPMQEDSALFFYSGLNQSSFNYTQLDFNMYNYYPYMGGCNAHSPLFLPRHAGNESL